MFFTPKGKQLKMPAQCVQGRSCNFCLLHSSESHMRKTASAILLLLVFLALGCHGKSDDSAQHIQVVMKTYTINPEVIRVKSGQKVELDVTTADVQHGLDIPELGIKESVQPGRTTTVSFTAPAKGEYKVACGVICGPHHDDMTGKLVVE